MAAVTVLCRQSRHCQLIKEVERLCGGIGGGIGSATKVENVAVVANVAVVIGRFPS